VRFKLESPAVGRSGRVGRGGAAAAVPVRGRVVRTGGSAPRGQFRESATDAGAAPVLRVNARRPGRRHERAARRDDAHRDDVLERLVTVMSSSRTFERGSIRSSRRWDWASSGTYTLTVLTGR
jgi:hypothetical protein